MFRLLGKAPLSLGPKVFLSTSISSGSKEMRRSLFAISICNLGYVAPTMLSAAIFWLVSRQGFLAGWLPKQLGEEGLVFILTDNRIDGVLFGILLGALTALVLRRVWPALIFCAVALASGVMAVNVGWGIWMGLCLGFWIYSGIVHRKLKSLSQALKLRAAVSLITILIIFRYSDFLAINLRTLELFENSRDNRFLQWAAAGALTLALDTLLAAVFFHFYNLFRQKK